MKSRTKLLPYPIIVRATKGDVEAITAVLKHYEGYIAVLATREFFDEFGNPHFFVDEEMRHRLETKLITKILTFSVA